MQLFKNHTTEAVFLIDTENAFNAINRKATLSAKKSRG